LNNHLHELAAIDFFTVPTATFRVLYVFVVLSIMASAICSAWRMLLSVWPTMPPSMCRRRA